MATKVSTGTRLNSNNNDSFYRTDGASQLLYLSRIKHRIYFIRNTIAPSMFLGAVLATASAIPAASGTHSLGKRLEDGVDCTTDLIDRSTPGLLFAVASDGTAVYCDEIDQASTEGW